MKRYLNFIQNDPIFSKVLGKFSFLVLFYILMGGYLVTVIENEYIKIVSTIFYFTSLIIFNLIFGIRFVKFQKSYGK
ncbi:hypothetical protein ACFDTO_34520 [Microbacteriaceae bacterium 4G12]